MNVLIKLTILVVGFTALTGCVSNTGEKYQANVYSSTQVNMKQEAKTVNILAVLPAKIEVDNKEGKAAAQGIGAFFGAVLGAAATNQQKNTTATGNAAGGLLGGAIGAGAGSMVSDKVLVEGVSLTYIENGKTLNSAQVGRSCEFKPGVAVMISMSEKETRIQPNDKCPIEVEK